MASRLRKPLKLNVASAEALRDEELPSVSKIIAVHDGIYIGSNKIPCFPHLTVL